MFIGDGDVVHIVVIILSKTVTDTMTLTPTSKNCHHHKVANKTSSPRSL